MASTPTDLETVARARLDRMIDVLSYASVGAFADALERAQVEAEDNFGMLEESLRLVIRELGEARDSADKALRELQKSKAELEEKLHTIESQKTAIQELSTPILDIWSDIVALPVVGAIDTGRAVEMTEKLLQRIVDGGARCAIIDLTGVAVVDTMTADHLIKMLKATRLLGCFCVITGIGPEIAETLVELDVGLGGVLTLRNLQSGLRACFAYLDAAERRRSDRPARGGKGGGSRA
jgi:rsbT co-antagonist protein RsbR